MGALSDFLHMVSDKLPFHNEEQVHNAHSLVDDVVTDVEGAINAVREEVATLRRQVSDIANVGVHTADQVATERQGTFPTDNTGHADNPGSGS